MDLIPYKGHGDLLSALGSIRDALVDDWRLLCAGRDDGIGAELRRQAQAAGIDSNVLWLGSRSDIPELYGAADIAVLCSHQEGFSNSLLEAMRAGLGIVATEVGGNAEALDGGSAGLLVPAREPRALAHAIKRLADDPELRSTLGTCARARIADHFSLERSASEHGDLYRRLSADEL